MIGAIAGDVIGSRFEGSRARTPDFDLFHHSCRFTDDTVCTLAVAKALLGDGILPAICEISAGLIQTQVMAACFASGFSQTMPLHTEAGVMAHR